MNTPSKIAPSNKIHRSHLPYQFEAGRIVYTSGTLELAPEEVSEALWRHLCCWWGECSAAEWNVNNQAVESGERLLSLWRTHEGVAFWILTEADRRFTTVLLPEEF